MPIRRRSRVPSLVCSPLLAVMPGADPGAGRAEEAYVDASAYVQSEAEIAAWYELTAALEREFEAICGDTFCEGEFSNIRPLRYRCSVHARSGRIGTCVWVLAASHEEIDPATGAITVHSQHWACRTPLAPGTTFSQLLAALGGGSPLYARLPGGGGSIYEGLVGCL